VRVEVVLLLEIWFPIFTNIMIHQGNWNDERHIIFSETIMKTMHQLGENMAWLLQKVKT